VRKEVGRGRGTWERYPTGNRRIFSAFRLLPSDFLLTIVVAAKQGVWYSQDFQEQGYIHGKKR
jgi:hypothetical protein